MPPSFAARIRPAISTAQLAASAPPAPPSQSRRWRRRRALGRGDDLADRAEHRQAGRPRRAAAGSGRWSGAGRRRRPRPTPAPSAEDQHHGEEDRPVRRGRHARHARRLDHLDVERAGPRLRRRCAAGPARDWRAAGHIAASAPHSRGSAGSARRRGRARSTGARSSWPRSAWSWLRRAVAAASCASRSAIIARSET